MEIFHFVKYSDKSSLTNYLNSNTATQKVTICFDIEDSIQDVFNQKNNQTLKKHYRLILQKLFLDVNKTPTIKYGIRINAIKSNEYTHDINLLKELKFIDYILIPKTENNTELEQLLNDLEINKIKFNEIIPIIESTKGIINLESIINLNTTKIRSIGFGHCDYNLEANHFPFFHQTSREYWTWIEKINSFLKPKKINFINSPFLELNNDIEFGKMISNLLSICGNQFGQFVLTHRQAMLCLNSNYQTIPYFDKYQNRLKINLNIDFALKYQKAFVNEKKDKGFTVTSDQNILLSPHEYLSSLKTIQKNNLKNFNFTFVGGCFPVQGNILFESLFHQHLKRIYEKQYNNNFNIDIIRYERFKNCLNKITTHISQNPTNALVFCIRTEPVLRLTKLSYKYLDKKGNTKRSFNFPFSKQLMPEKYDLLNIEFTLPIAKRVSNKRSKNWINLNYILGIIIYNHKAAMRKYLDIINELNCFCKLNNIPLYILGPALRTNTKVEKYISIKLEKYLVNTLNMSDIRFIKGSDIEANGEKLFHENGIYANENYHKLIAERIFDQLRILH